MKLFAYSLREYDELACLEAQAAEHGFEFGWTSDSPTLENVELARGCDSILIITTPMDAPLLDAFHAIGVRFIATRSIGFDHIDLPHAYELGMRIGHAAYAPDGVADYTVMLIVMALRKVKYVFAKAAAQDFDLRGNIGRSLSSCTVGIVGTGSIGCALAKRLQGFGCQILAYDPFPREDVAQMARYVELDELLRLSDVVTLHAPGTKANLHMIGAEQLALMKPDAVLVNAARGNLVDTEALIDAIERGVIGAAALDTIEHELNLYYLDRGGMALPNRDRATLIAFPNVVVSPHMAFYTQEAVEGMIASNVSALLAFEAGGESPYEIPR